MLLIKRRYFSEKPDGGHADILKRSLTFWITYKSARKFSFQNFEADVGVT